MITPLMAEFDGFVAMVYGSCATARCSVMGRADEKGRSGGGTRREDESSKVVGFKTAVPRRRLASPPQRKESPDRETMPG